MSLALVSLLLSIVCPTLGHPSADEAVSTSHEGAGDLTIPWSNLGASDAATSVGGGFSLVGSIGESAALLSGENFSIQGGFWSFEETIPFFKNGFESGDFSAWTQPSVQGLEFK